MFDRADPSHVRQLARALAEASGSSWERISIAEMARWLARACALADALLDGPWRGFAC